MEKNETNGENSVEFKTPAFPAFKSPLQPVSEGPKITPQSSSSSPAELIYKDKAIPIPYKEPPWSGVPPEGEGYTVEEIKNGTIVATHKLEGKSFFVVGRLTGCDIVIQHPSSSRFHTVLQFKSENSADKPAGFYLYDLESTHGTYHNKNRCFPKTYYRLRVGHTIKFGNSTRLFILQGPDTDMEDESDLSASQLMAIAAEKARKKAEEEEKEREKNQPKDTGISWGMSNDDIEVRDPDDEEHPDMEKNPFALTSGSGNNEKLYINDPKKFLKAWFEQEGYDDLEFECTEKGFATFHCKIDLPIDAMGTGETVVVAEVTHKGKKKEAMAQCALEACRLLDKYGVLTGSRATHDSADVKRARKWEENDYYSSDEDEYLDRTSAIQEKREKRMKLAQKVSDKPIEQKVETFESLNVKHDQLIKELQDTEEELQKEHKLLSNAKSLNKSESDDLDSYMEALSKTGKGEVSAKEKISKLKQKLNTLKQDLSRVDKLIEIARPVSLTSHVTNPKTEEVQKPKPSGIIIGKRKGGVTNVTKVVESSLKTAIDETSTVTPPSKTLESERPIKKMEKESELSTPEQSFKDTQEKPAIHKIKQVEPKILKGPSKPPKVKATPKAEEGQSSDDNAEVDEPMEKYEEETEVWAPPKGQTGDGRTSLNEKYGY